MFSWRLYSKGGYIPREMDKKYDINEIICKLISALKKKRLGVRNGVGATSDRPWVRSFREDI